VLALLLIPPAWFVGVIRAPNPKLGGKLQAVASIAHPLVAEASGLVQSATNPEILWLHNDSGDVPRIFAMNAQGEVIVAQTHQAQAVVTVARPPEPGQRLYQGISVGKASLRDWEDIAVHGDRLYIAEMGNNLSKRRDLGVYEVVEPDPAQTEAVDAQAFIPVAYPDQTEFPPSDRWDYDCEAMFWWEGHLYFVTKTRPAYRVFIQGTDATLYRLDSMDPNKVNVLTRVDQANDLGGWVTAADVSHDGRYLAVLIESPVQSVWLYERPAEGDRFFSQPTSVRRLVFHDAGQLECLAFLRPSDPGQSTAQDEILILNEQRDIFRLSLDDFEPVTLERK
jgi:hypothetical protein